MPSCGGECEKITTGNGGRCGVDQRMKIDGVERHETGISDKPHCSLSLVIYQSERCHGPRFDAEQAEQRVSIGEGQSPCADLAVQPVETQLAISPR